MRREDASKTSWESDIDRSGNFFGTLTRKKKKRSRTSGGRVQTVFFFKKKKEVSFVQERTREVVSIMIEH